jgi:hypothetical protein
MIYFVYFSLDYHDLMRGFYRTPPRKALFIGIALCFVFSSLFFSFQLIFFNIKYFFLVITLS